MLLWKRISLITLASISFLASNRLAAAIFEDKSELLSHSSETVKSRTSNRIKQKFVKRTKIISIDVEALKNAEEAVLELFDGQQITLLRTKFELRGKKSFLWEGEALESSMAQITLTVFNGDLAGHLINVPGDFHITYLGEGRYLLEEIDSSQFIPEAPPLRPPHALIAPLPGEKTIKNMGTNNPLYESILAASSTVDIVVFYTAAVASAYGNIKSEIQNGIDLMNAALERSQVSYRVRLTYRGQVSYTESGTAATELSRLTNTNDGYMDTVHSTRTANCGDVVSLWTKDTSDACGVAWMLQNTTSSTNTTYAFNVVDVDCANSNLSFPHEVGHNLGANHDTTADAGNGLFSYSHGHFVDQQWRTILAYTTGCTNANCPRVGYYSNPSVSYSGSATGVSNVSDNALTFRTSMPYVSNYVGGDCTLAGEDPDNLETTNEELLGSQCFVATATYGSFFSTQIKGLRRLRDNFLSTYSWGRSFIRAYYKLSPPLATFIQEHAWARAISLVILTPWVLATNLFQGWAALAIIIFANLAGLLFISILVKKFMARMRNSRRS